MPCRRTGKSKKQFSKTNNQKQLETNTRQNKEETMSSSESSSSSSSESSAPSSPEAPEKPRQSPSSPPEVSKESNSQSSSPEASKKVLKSRKDSNTSGPPKKVSKSPSSSPEAHKKVNKPPKELPKESNNSESPTKVSSSPEAPEKVLKSPKEVPKESGISGPPKKGFKSPPGSPEASKNVLRSYKKVPQKLQTSWPPNQPSKSPSSSPEAPEKIVKSSTAVAKGSHTGAPWQASQPPPSSQERPKKILRDKPPLCQEESGKAPAAPEGSTEVQKVHSSVRDSVIALKDRPRGSFKSSLQVLLKRQEEELEKTIEYKEKLERGELDDEEEDAEEEEAGTRGRRGSEDNTVEAKRRKNSEGGGRREGKEDQPKEKPKKAKPKEDEDVKVEEKKPKKAKQKEDEDVKTKTKKEEDKEKSKERKTKEEQDEDSKGKGKGEDKNAEEKANITDKVKAERKEKEEPKQRQRSQASEEEQDKKTEEREDKEVMKARKEEKIEESPKREKMAMEGEKPTKDQTMQDEDQKKEEEKKEVKTKQQEEETRKEEKQKKEEEEEKKAKKKEEMTKEKQKREEEEKKKPKKKEEVRDEGPRKEDRQKEGKMSFKKDSKEEKTLGHLYLKRKRTFNPWKEYYFVLDGLLLTYYRSQQQYQQISGMKGSLDLSLVEVVQPERPGLLKTHHPFCLTRRNLPSIHLAAATKEERQRWVDVLRAAVRPHRLSACNSDQTLHTVSSAEAAAAAADHASETKSNTLPARVKGISSHSSSVSDDEEDEEKEVKKEEEPELIQPKKVLRVPIGLPMAVVNLGQVKLKKTEKEAKKDDDGETAIAAAAAAHSTAQDSPREKSPPGELFGVVLKKTKKQEEEEEKKAPKDTTTTVTAIASTTTSVRRPSKQPVIPLNSGKLLVVPEVKPAKTSPDTQKRQTPERRTSPSPSLPISKSVQALTKSAEEVRATQVDVASPEPSSSASTTPLSPAAAGEGEAAAGKLCHAQTTEVRYSDVEVMDEAGEVVEVLDEVVEVVAAGREAEREMKNDAAKEDDVHETRQDVQNRLTRQDAVEMKDEERHKGDESLATEARSLRPLMGIENAGAVCAGLQGGSAMQERKENLDKECRQSSAKEAEAPTEEHQREDDSEGATTPPPDTPIAPQPLTPPASPASSKASADSDKSSSPPSPVSSPCKSSSPSTTSSPSSPTSMQAVKSSPSLPQSPPVSPEGRDSEGSQVTVPVVKGTPQQEKKMEEKGQEGSWEARRPRADSNESTGTSSSEGGEKKPGKLENLKRKLRGGSSHKDKRDEPASPKEPKKRRGSNAFSELLARKRNGGKKPSEEPQHQTSQSKAPSDTPAASQPAINAASRHSATASSESPPAEASVPPGRAQVRVNLEKADPAPPQPTGDSLLTQADRFLEDQPRAEVAAAPSTAPPPSDGTCHDTYSLSVGSCDDQPPSIPEKTRIRARSPNHDVPRSNRPLTNIHHLEVGEEDEDEDAASQTVDGYITEEQIDALLNAKENREKRKLSKKGAHHLLSRLDSEKGASLPAAVPPPSSEEWDSSRPPFNSFSSVESDESLIVTTFLGVHRSSSSSGSGDSLSPETEILVETQRRAPRPTDAITAKNRLSLTSPEFTVQEEEGLSSPETAKARPPCQGGDNDKRMQKNGDDPKAKVERGAEAEAAADADIEAEQEDFFPVVGRDVQLRQPATQHGAALSLPKAELRTSGIISLKEYLKAQEEEEDLEEVRSGISRLGHSAAVEKLKQASREQ